MDLNRFLQTMVMITLLSLVYINMQMKIIDLAYAGKAKEKAIRELQEETGQFTYHILALKSSNNLGSKLLAEKTDMRFLGAQDIIRVKSNEVAMGEEMASAVSIADKKSPIFNLLSLAGKE